MANDIKIKVTVDTQDLGKVKKDFGALREQGEKLRGLGGAITMGITAPILAGGAALVKFGADAKKQVDDAAKMMQEANLSGDPAKIREAAAANRAISLAVRDSANSYGQLQVAMAPVNDAVQKLTAEGLRALVPLLKEGMPLLTGMAKGATDAIKAFTALPEPIKGGALAIGGLALALGPTVTILGQAQWLLGTIGALAPGVAAGITGIVAPVAAVGLAVYSLIKLFEMDEFKKGMAILRGQATLLATGDRTKAAQSTLAGYQELGGGSANTETGNTLRSLLSGGVPAQQQGGVTQYITYAPQSMISTGTPAEVQQSLKVLQQLNPQAANTSTGRR